MSHIKERVLPAEAPAIVAGICAAGREIPVDPTIVHRNEVKRLMRSKWLPPLAEAAKLPRPSLLARLAPTVEVTKGGEDDEQEKRKAAVQRKPNVMKKNTFPFSEIRESTTTKIHLKNNPSSRYVLAFRDKAHRADERAKAYEEAACRLALANTNGINWSVIKNISRNPASSQPIKGLRTSYAPESRPARTAQSGAMNLTTPRHVLPPLSQALSATSLFVSEGEENEDKGRSPSANLQLVQDSAGSLPSLLARSASFQDAQNWMQANALWRQKHLPELGNALNEDEYCFGKPEGIDEDVGDQFNIAFKELTKLGSTVRKNQLDIEADKNLFEEDTTATLPIDSVTSVTTQRPSITSSHNSTPDPTVAEVWKRKLQNPAQNHHSAFAAYLDTTRKELSTTLKSRSHDRLRVCKDDESALGVLKLAVMDARNCTLVGPTRHSHTPWDHVVPYMWYKDAYPLVKAHLRERQVAKPSTPQDPKKWMSQTTNSDNVVRHQRISNLTSARTRTNLLFDYITSARSTVFTPSMMRKCGSKGVLEDRDRKRDSTNVLVN
ncbi:uncharacterized protein SPPG_06941 [Spizellomyces punctatus DAOM BR117]|uniref:Uncharacterized protein n=1 Tax=Spizellomyces punctatus (strain DAOM BR117) TaxID=645134 RepID=A0A0L0HB57_SPIPD|nr:uncharacterized protein SPPG_06941 [Spizellomyces punctatus DAOM BR117]KNC97953.1 hypothetical protein SPPG_06941 [Spizellomyces punctatus DAOM BR117]|eukprot:XP_016605993.1 hypothetical protein SPPG_06941 [Spizellomyces punctatus DAOM BR117]